MASIDVIRGAFPTPSLVSMSLPDIQALASRLHARGTAPIGSDSSASQADMLAASQVIRGLLARSIAASETAGALALQLTSPVERREG